VVTQLGGGVGGGGPQSLVTKCILIPKPLVRVKSLPPQEDSILSTNIGLIFIYLFIYISFSFHFPPYLPPPQIFLCSQNGDPLGVAFVLSKNWKKINPNK